MVLRSYIEPSNAYTFTDSLTNDNIVIASDSRIILGIDTFPECAIIIDGTSTFTKEHYANSLYVNDTLFISGETSSLFLKNVENKKFELGRMFRGQQYKYLLIDQNILYVSVHTNFDGDVRVGNNLNIGANLDVIGKFTSGSTEINGNCTIFGDEYTYGHATYGGNLTINGEISCRGNIKVGGNATTNGSLTVQKNVTIKNDVIIRGNNHVHGNVVFHGDAEFEGTVKFAGGFEVLDSATINNDMNINGDLSVFENMNVNNSCFVGGEAHILGMLTVDSNAKIMGDVNIEGNLTVDNETTFNTRVTINGDSVIYGNLSCDDVSVSQLIVNDTFESYNDTIIYGFTTATSLKVTESLIINDTLYANIVNSDEITSKGVCRFDDTITVNGNLTTNDMTINNAFFVLGNSTFERSLTVDGTLTAINDVDCQGRLDVSGLATFKSDVSIDRALTVRGDAFFLGTSVVRGNMDVNGTIVISNILNVENDVQFENLNCHGTLAFANMGISSSLYVDNVRVEQNAFIQSLNVGTNVDIGGDITVGNNCIIENDLSVYGLSRIRDVLNVGTFRPTSLIDVFPPSLTVSGEVTISEDLSILGNVSVTGDITVDMVSTDFIDVRNTLTSQNIIIDEGLTSQHITCLGTCLIRGTTFATKIECGDINATSIITSDLIRCDTFICTNATISNSFICLGISTFANINTNELRSTSRVFAQILTSDEATIDAITSERATVSNLNTTTFVGIASFTGQVIAHGFVSISEALTCKNANIESALLSDHLTVKNNAYFEGNVKMLTLDIGTDSDIVSKQNVLTVKGGTNIIDGDIIVNGNATFLGVCNMSNAFVETLQVSNTANITGTIISPSMTVTSMNASLLNVNGNCNVNGSLFITGQQINSGDLTVVGSAQLNGTCTCNGPLTVSGLISSNGIIIGNASSIVLTDLLIVHGNATIKSNCTINGMLTARNITATSSATVNSIIASDAEILSLIANTLTVNGDISTRTLNVSGATTGSFTVNGVCSASSITSRGIFTFENNVIVKGTTTIEGNANILGRCTFQNGLVVNNRLDALQIISSGACNCESANVTDLTVTGSLTSNDATFDSLVVMKDSTVNGNLSIMGTLNVMGTANVSKDETILGDLHVQQGLYASSIYPFTTGSNVMINSPQTMFMSSGILIATLTSQGITLTPGKTFTINGINIANLSDVCYTGNYDDLLNKPNLSTVSFTGSWRDMRDIPSFAPIAYSGRYTDLIGVPDMSQYMTVADFNTQVTLLEQAIAALEARLP